MRRWWLSLAAFALFSAGLAVGALGQSFVATRTAADLEILRGGLVEGEIGCTGSNLIALGKIRSGDSEDATSFLESALSLNVVILDRWRSSYGSDHRSEIDRVLQKVAEYRRTHPFVGPEPLADENVARILSRQDF
jgi:hypothetical protein